jgi:hypothetical protein
MKLLNASIIVLAVCLSSVFATGKFSFDGYKLVKIHPKTNLQLETISKWENNNDVIISTFFDENILDCLLKICFFIKKKFDVWGRAKTTEETVTALMSPQAFIKYKVYMALLEMSFETVVPCISCDTYAIN